MIPLKIISNGTFELITIISCIRFTVDK